MRIADANGNFTSYEASANLPDTGITSFLADDEGNIWLGSNIGLFRLRRQLITTYSVAHGLAAKEIYPLLQTMPATSFLRFALQHLKELA